MSQPTLPLNLPQPFGRYRLLRLLGRGGMGAVFVAEDTQLEREVALKLPHALSDANPASVERFFREAKIAGSFHHPNLCPVYDAGQVGGLYYFTMPLLKGEPLSSVLRTSGPLSPRKSAWIAWKVAEAMAVAHQAGVYHRDLKPGNVLMSERGEPVVMDFGLARRTATDDRLTLDGAILGTPGYLPPEAIGYAGDEGLGAGWDVYSLGAMLYQMLTNRPPFQGTLEEIVSQVRSREPDPPTHFNSDVDPRLNAICLKALARDPASRFATMREFAGALAEYLGVTPESGETILEATRVTAGHLHSPTPRVWDLSRPGTVSRRSWILGGIAVLLLAGLAWWLFTRFSTNHPPPVDPLPANSEWVGHFKFRPPMDLESDVEVRVTQRSGDAFDGVYRTSKGEFEWLIRGKLTGEVIEWDFTQAIRDSPDQKVVGIARVRGTLHNGVMDVLYYLPAGEEMADMTLRRAGTD